MSTIQTDEDYVKGIQSLLMALKGWSHPLSVPLTEDTQSQFIHDILCRAHDLLNSEPHLRGEMVKAFNDLAKVDAEALRKETDRYREIASTLYEALSVCRGWTKKDREIRRYALEVAEKWL